MAYIFPNEGERYMLSAALMTGAAIGTCTLRLYSNNATLTATMMASSFTELTAGGYANKTINLTAWSAPFVSAGSAVASANMPAFTFTGVPNQSAYGYEVRSNTGLTIVAESFSDGPYSLTNAGDTVTVTPYIKGGSGSSN